MVVVKYWKEGVFNSHSLLRVHRDPQLLLLLTVDTNNARSAGCCGQSKGWEMGWEEDSVLVCGPDWLELCLLLVLCSYSLPSLHAAGLYGSSRRSAACICLDFRKSELFAFFWNTLPLETAQYPGIMGIYLASFFFFFCLCVVTLELPGILLERRNKFYGYWRGPGVGCRRKQESSEDCVFRHALWVRIFHGLLSVTALQRFVCSPPPGQMTTFS